jgi:protein-disulfide isomerase
MALDEIINERLIDRETKDKGIDRAKLIEQEITGKIVQPTDADVAAFFQTNQERMQGKGLDELRPAIRNYLVQERSTRARTDFLEQLRKKAQVRVMLDPPRQTIATAGHASRGPANAPIQLVEFADFQCPYCLRSHPTVTQVLNTYGDRVHFVFRHFPLPNHPNARPAAEAAACAGEQNRFWQFYDAVFADPTKLSNEDLKAHAVRAGANMEKFNTCFDNRKFKDTVEADLKEGTEAGVTGTPAFFINGRALIGAQPFEAFKQIIDEELALRASR